MPEASLGSMLMPPCTGVPHPNDEPRSVQGAPIPRGRLETVLEQGRLPTPVLVMDVAAVVSQYERLAHALPGARIYYAAKANPAPEILRALSDLGSCFDVASAPEIAQCQALGIPPGRPRSVTR
jgi:diaminopimelate decarboxylase